MPFTALAAASTFLHMFLVNKIACGMSQEGYYSQKKDTLNFITVMHVFLDKKEIDQ